MTENNPEINYQLQKLAEITASEIRGNQEISVDNARGIEESNQKSVTFADQEEYLIKALNSEAAVIVSGYEIYEQLDSAAETNKTFLLTDNPRRAYAQIADLLTPRPYENRKISNKAVIDESVKKGKNISIHPGVVIAENVKIGNDTVLAPGVIIGPDVEIGDNCLLHPGVIIERGTIIRDRVIIQSGAVIGSDGFGFATDKDGHHKIPQQGNVIIESEVEIGANVTIDRGASGPTIIRQGSKLDNLIQIGHNVEVGEESLLIAHTGIAGSTKLGRRVTLGGQSGVVGHIKLADNTTAAARAMVTSPTNEGDFISGAPAQIHREALKEQAYLRRLPKYIDKIKQLEKRLAELENK
ncbi:UDP-3-O-[3-hydroxymyristoyl] glucosamine N-acyltransferase [Halanaerobium saccharolyticum]|uniref:UDP-3-O-acylglucosamine N-acyltransferase n=1 Tax=Halanaerobium saccharolyticum TaxID=43595 RepID=A0A4R7Z8A2_9FIRM|nr:UDP-3-O-(3-hydroxymyristoyl)glucosamine N-acyltransferase [Halanaerobium saccharolyticum]RAK09800.1 UDP-3-O-[3-hydroxymyristoyl] glucosamine N-acyltransferase [Halanaerobium saccharolyticum]TDW07362.1 UDP-3-O-[3-hydroxymyristoyl] glucosamine N-acyltransferase [Halanaerobium saccharolyticum]TDX61241.1 UDP-3-O-[3-hydroxymyristoyl] glucosamine N-acyltransferase [Halanaerobium saccharolyticum]